MITLENLQDATVWSHQNELTDEEDIDLHDAAVFVETYAQAFGLHPSSVMVGLRLGYLAERSSRGELEELVEVPDRPTEEEYDTLPKLDPSAFRGIENDPED